MSGRERGLTVIAAILVGMAILILPSSLWFWRLLSGLVLFCFLPGLALSGFLFPEPGSLSPLERWVLSAGSSYALLVLGLLLCQLLPGNLTSLRLVLVGVFVVTFFSVLGFLAKGTIHRQQNEVVSKTVLAQVVLLVILASLLRFTHLDYAEFQDDELDVTDVAVQVILGEKEALLNDVRGPTRTLVASAFFLVTGRWNELSPRLPSALASVLTVVVVFLLAQRMFGFPVGFIAGLLLSVEGFELAQGRIVQQSFVNLMTVLTIFCFYRLTQSDERLWGRWQTLGSLFLAVGLLTHYEVVLIVPAMLLLYFSNLRLSKGVIRRGVVSLAILLIFVGGFYLPFALNPHFEITFQYYSRQVIGWANNLRSFLLINAFYNSIYYVFLLSILLSWFYARYIGYICHMKFSLPSLPFSLLFGGGILGLLLIPPAPPTVPLVNGLLFLFLLALLLLSVFSPWMSVECKSLSVWFFSYFIPYSFIVRLPRLHYYAYAPPWAIIAAVALKDVLSPNPTGAIDVSCGGRRKGFPLWLRLMLALLVGVLYALSAFYAWKIFVQHVPEYALTYPEHRSALYPTIYDRRLGEAFGFPHKSGWKVIGYLYMTGALRGGYETNELYQKARWYTYWVLHNPDREQYYYIADVPHREQAGPYPQPFVAKKYKPIGVVLVNNVPRLHLYERNDLSAGSRFTVYRAEEYESLYDDLHSLDRYYLFRNYEGDDRFFRDLAVHMETFGRQSDGLILEAPEQVEFLSYWYRGNLPYYPLPRQEQIDEEVTRQELEYIIGQHKRLYALFWAVEERDPQHFVERWLSEHLFSTDDRWFGNVRLVLYTISRAAYFETAQHSIGVYLDDKVVLSGYSLWDEAVPAGNTLSLTLFWRCLERMEKRYKVFVHLLDKRGTVVAQRDAEPVGGTRLTTSWLVDETVVDNYGLPINPELPSGTYRLMVGMYDLETDQRLPAYSEGGERLSHGSIFLEEVQITRE